MHFAKGCFNTIHTSLRCLSQWRKFKALQACFLACLNTSLEGSSGLLRERSLFLSIPSAAFHFWSRDLPILLAATRTWLLTSSRPFGVCASLSATVENRFVQHCMRPLPFYLSKSSSIENETHGSFGIMHQKEKIKNVETL